MSRLSADRIGLDMPSMPDVARQRVCLAGLDESTFLTGPTTTAFSPFWVWSACVLPESHYGTKRWYEPVTGRWLSNDPIGISGGLNQYVFCGGNPVNFTDPSGLEIRSPTTDEQQQIDTVLDTLRASSDSSTRALGEQLAGRTYRVDTSMTMPKDPNEGTEWGWVAAFKYTEARKNTINLAPHLFTEPSGHQPGISGKWDLRVHVMEIMMHENWHLLGEHCPDREADLFGRYVTSVQKTLFREFGPNGL